MLTLVQLIYYSPTLFEQLGLDYEMQITMSGVLNVAQMVATCSAFFFLDKVGRKPPLLLGSFMNTVSHTIVAVMIGKYSNDWPGHPKQAWTGVAFILIFMVSRCHNNANLIFSSALVLAGRRSLGLCVSDVCNNSD